MAFSRYCRNKRSILASGAEGSSPKLAELLGKVIEGLRNEALQVAMKFSDDELRGEDAIDVLVERVENYVIAFKWWHEDWRSDVQTAEQTNDVINHTPLEMDHPESSPLTRKPQCPTISWRLLARPNRVLEHERFRDDRHSTVEAARGHSQTQK